MSSLGVYAHFLFAVLFTLFEKRRNRKKGMAQYTDGFLQHYDRLKRVGSNAISKKFKVLRLLFNIEHKSVF